MNRKIAVGLWTALALAYGAPPPASTQGPAEKFLGWLCEIDLPPFSAMPDTTSIFTTNSLLHCINNAPPEQMSITCTGTVPPATLAQLGITKGTKHFSDIPCTINGVQCGVPGFLVATTSSLKIKSQTGKADLDCKFKP
ncbi:MAG: hypothetical protein ACREV4_11480 [Gammaproteobacteria bacterium]